MSGYVLAIDQGTTSSRAIVFDDGFRVVGMGQEEFPQHFPRSGWVEHDPEDIWSSVVATVRSALADASLSAADIAALGITNQRETTLIWDRATGKPIHNAIVWQDRRTAEICQRLVAEGSEPAITAKTGLIVDPYFSGTKIAWLLDNVDGARAKAEAGKLAFGTVDSFLLWRLTGGRVHATDATNASRTMLFDIAANDWDDELLRLLRVPRALLPSVEDCDAEFGTTDASLFGAAIPIRGVAGDQHAATLGQACFEPGMVKSTYGTGCFAVLNTGAERITSHNRLLTTIAYRLAGKTAFALEGSIFVAGAAVQWLRDGLKIVDRAEQTGPMAARADEAQDVYMVPAFTGLGAPWWDAEARGAIYGLTRKTGPDELARAALEAVCFQTADLLTAMRRDWSGASDTILRVDGGMVASDWTMQRLADILDAPVDRPVVLETTALGAAWVAGQKAGVWPDMAGFAQRWHLERRFTPQMDAVTRGRKLTGWADAVRRTLTS
ncbi:MAG: glycerol kinase GlpK [Aurantimonas endophytica]|uniref:Glycerol kinase n=1 Tax=Aurantimonas endophytica TaxID=1522175 RepID=A0A7W6HFL2_9HYPH|nr:glycerol kinase GlpK [Aurantimonas endophytica]MBB4004326.1 glycerol kinase [Aurantimonas endophytica]MCO6405166.1 glycerol kinase GlpK [Aurantimonas endophytica]